MKTPSPPRTAEDARYRPIPGDRYVYSSIVISSSAVVHHRYEEVLAVGDGTVLVRRHFSNGAAGDAKMPLDHWVAGNEEGFVPVEVQ